jgi:hypothetical protein
MRTRYLTSKDQFNHRQATSCCRRYKYKGGAECVVHRRGVFFSPPHRAPIWRDAIFVYLPRRATKNKNKNPACVCILYSPGCGGGARQIEFIRGGMNIKGQQRSKTLSLVGLSIVRSLAPSLGRWKWTNIILSHMDTKRAPKESRRRDDPNFFPTQSRGWERQFTFFQEQALAETNKTNQVCERDFSHR